MTFRLAFPDGVDAPAESAQGCVVPFVADGVSLELLSPPSAFGFRNARVLAVRVEMPEAAVAKNADAPAWQNDIGVAWKIASVQPEAISHGVQQAAHDELGLRVLPANARHQAAALLGGKGVGHDWGSCL